LGASLTSVIDGAVAIGVGALEDVHELLAVLAITQASLQFIEGDATVVVGVQCLENLLQFLDIVRIRLDSDCHQCNLLEFLAFAEALHVAHLQVFNLLGHLLTVVALMLSHKGVLEGLTRGESALRPRDQLLDQIFGLVGDGVPLFAIELELADSNHLEYLLVVVAVKRWVAAEEDVEHAAGAPHVARDVVVASEHLRRDVVGGAGARLHAMDATSLHNFRQAEVDDLQV